MSVVDESPLQKERLTWKKPRTHANWIWLICSILIYAGISFWYYTTLKVQKYPGPDNDPLRIFGIVAFVLVLLVAAYSLRRRFVRILPGRVDGWLWLHTWFGILSILIAFEHENYANVLHTIHFSPKLFISSAGGTSALYALILLVISGIVGRLMDIWQARVIAAEAHRNGVGIAARVEERLQELKLLVERLSAGKSTVFKQFCTQTLAARNGRLGPVPQLTATEQRDFERAYNALTTRERLLHSLRRQQQAYGLIRLWRNIHIPLACLALAIISFHSLIELTKMALQLLHR